jgi:hypothetical protein
MVYAYKIFLLLDDRVWNIITLNSEFDKAVITQRSAVNDRVCLFDLAKALHEDIKGSQLVEVNNAGYGF